MIRPQGTTTYYHKPCSEVYLYSCKLLRIYYHELGLVLLYLVIYIDLCQFILGSLHRASINISAQ